MKKMLRFKDHGKRSWSAKTCLCLLLLCTGMSFLNAQVPNPPLSIKNKNYKTKQSTNLIKLNNAPFVANPSVGSWTTLTNQAPSTNSTMTLMSDGTVLVKSGSGNLYKKLTPDASGSYINGTWSTVAPMHDTRLYYSSQLLKDGRLYVAGGEYGSGGGHGEVYDPVNNTWTSTPLPGITLYDANSEILDDGRVLQGAVFGTGKQTFLYDPSTNSYTAGPNTLDYYDEAAWVKLPDGSILMADVPFAGDDHSTERYIPSLNQWVLDAPTPVSLFDLFGYETGGACLLPNGKVIFFGSTGHTAIYTPSGNTSPGSWVAGPDFPDGQGTPDAAAAMMANGKVLCAVSPIPDQFDNFPSPTSFYEYDYVSNSFTQVGAPGGGSYIINSSYVFTFLNLPDGSILAAQQGDYNLYVYTPSGNQVEEGKPVITAIDQKSCSTYTLHGTGFNGNSEGSSYGDDWQMNTNYPIVRLTSGSNVYYCCTTNWNSTGVMRGSAPDSVNVTLPAGLPDGTYSLVVTANGIASDPITITTTPKTWYLDADGDGHYVTAVLSCVSPGPDYTTTISIPGDCNDADASVWQTGSLYIDADGDGYDNGQAYICYGATVPTGYSLTTNGSDCNDGDGSVWQTGSLYIDADGDGYDNGQADICYGATAPAGYSLTTNGTDCNDGDGSVWQTGSLYIDADGDGYDNGQADICYGATAPAGYSLTTNGSDCNDADGSVWQTGLLYIDGDGDGYDNGQADICYGATAPAGYSLTTNGSDCNDADASVWQTGSLYIDADGDGYDNGVADVCYGATAPAGYSLTTNGTDCNDNDVSVHTAVMYYIDADHDNYGSSETALLCASTAPSGYSSQTGDCDDNNAAINPGAVEICGDNIDNNCNGQIDEGCTTNSFRITIADKAKREGNRGQSVIRFTVQLNKPATSTIHVNYATQDVTATAGSDYVATSGTVTFNTGVKKQTISVVINGDKTREPDETFKVVLSNPTGAVIADGEAYGTILNDDGAALAGTVQSIAVNTVQLQSKSVTVSPNPATTMVYVQLNGYSGIVTMQLHSLDGKVIKQEKLQVASKSAQQRLDITGVANGIYLLTVTDEKGNMQSQKIVISR